MKLILSLGTFVFFYSLNTGTITNEKYGKQLIRLDTAKSDLTGSIAPQAITPQQIPNKRPNTNRYFPMLIKPLSGEGLAPMPGSEKLDEPKLKKMKPQFVPSKSDSAGHSFR